MKKELSPRDFCKHVSKHIGYTIKLLKCERGVTSKKLAEALGVSVQQLVKYESGLNRISLGRLLIICELFQYSITDLIQDVCKSLEIITNINKDDAKFPKLTNIAKLNNCELQIINKFINIIASK